jgi:hypothetical protein
MLNITYNASDAKIAEQLKADLAQTRLRLEHPMLVVLVSSEALRDESVQASIQEAKAQNHRIAFIKTKPIELTKNMSDLPPLDVSAKYDSKRVVQYLNRVDMGAQRLKRGRQLLVALLIGAGIMFVVAMWGIITQRVGFPVERYATEYALELEQISTYIFPTLDYLQPRTTDDALNYSATVDKLPTRILIFALQTATNVPMNNSATQDAIRAIETNAVGTAAVMTQQAQVTATATP